MNSDGSGEKPGSLTLGGAVSLGTGVMIGAGIFALTGQVAELAGDLFPVALLAAALVVAASAYSYVKLSNSMPSSGGIAMFLKEEYGLGVATGVFSLFMYLSMVINESLVARTFGAYTLQVIDLGSPTFWVPALGVALLAATFVINLSGNKVIQIAEGSMSLVKIGGLALLAIGGLAFADWANLTNGSTGTDAVDPSATGFLAAIALSILAYKGFTTITNSGGEIVDPHRNVGRAIIIALGLCTALYLMLAVAVAANLRVPDIIAAQDYALAEAARPAFGDAGVWITVGVAIVATASGVIASIFAASRMLAMLTRMDQVPHLHLGMPGKVRTHTTVYTVAIAMALTVFFDLKRIAALGAIFYLIMDIAIHWGLIRHLRDRIEFRVSIVAIAIILDVVVLSAFVWIKATSDPTVLLVAAVGILLIIGGERWLMRSHTDDDGNMRRGHDLEHET
ncbi:MAG: APC family permease [Acidimicrobiales bacterium]